MSLIVWKFYRFIVEDGEPVLRHCRTETRHAEEAVNLGRPHLELVVGAHVGVGVGPETGQGAAQLRDARGVG